MFGIFVIASYVLMACAGPPVNGYSLGTLSGGRGQEYTSGYRTSTFGLKDNQADYSENGGSHRYSVGSGNPSYSSTTGSYQVSDSGYSDSNQPSTYASQNVGSQNSGGLSSSAYASEPAGLQSGTSELVGASYSASGSTTGGLSYTPSGSSSSGGNHASSFEYSELPVSGQSQTSLSNEREQYSSHPASSYVSYSVGGPKSTSYSQANHASHPGSRYSPSSSSGFTPSQHAISSPSSSYPGENSHRVVSPGHAYASGQSLKSFLAAMHGNGPNYIHGSSPHRTSPGHHVYASASNQIPGYSSRGPTSGYYAGGNSLYPRGGNPGGKIIIVKENSPHHPGSVYPAEHHGYNGAMFAASSPSYKIRNVGSHGSHGPPSFSNSYSPSSPHSVVSSHSSNPSSFFSFL